MIDLRIKRLGDLAWIQWIAFIIFVGAIVLMFLDVRAPSLVWTAIIPVIPLLIITIGYHTWRNVCPLAMFSLIGKRFATRSRKVPRWLVRHFITVQFWFFFIALALRLLFLNADGMLLGLFFVAVIVASAFSGWYSNGKVWCNYICPVGIVERIYCLSNAHEARPSSQCSGCTACKKDCPDIDAEANHWKEIDAVQRRFAVYAFPGLVFAFYFYYYLKAGTWDYYFDGAWAFETLSCETLWQPGFFFLPEVPKIAAVFLTLLALSTISYWLFRGIEILLNRTAWGVRSQALTVRHVAYALAAYTAFNVFYFFAGAPTYRHFPNMYMMLHFIVIGASTWLLVREIARTKAFFLQERLAKKVLKKEQISNWAGINLKEVYYTHIAHQTDLEQKLVQYREGLAELLGEGVLDEEGLSTLQTMRKQMGISEQDHEAVIRQLRSETPELFDATSQGSMEQCLQRNGYIKAVKAYLEAAHTPDPDVLESYRHRFGLSIEEHRTLLDELIHETSALEKIVMTVLDTKKALAEARRSIPDHSASMRYLRYLLRRNAFDRLIALHHNIALVLGESGRQQWQEAFEDRMSPDVDKAVALLKEAISDEASTRLERCLSADDNGSEPVKVPDKTTLQQLAEGNDIWISTAALLVMHEADIQPDAAFLERLTQHSDTNLARLADYFRRIINGDEACEDGACTVRVQRIAFLHGITLFETLDAPELAKLADAMTELCFSEGKIIVKEGEPGHAMYIIIEGCADVVADGRTVARVGVGDIVGEIAVIARVPRTASVIACGNVKVLELSAETLRHLMRRNADLAIELLQQSTGRLFELQRAGGSK